MKTKIVALVLAAIMISGGAVGYGVTMGKGLGLAKAGRLSSIISGLNMTGEQKGRIALVLAANREKNRPALIEYIQARRNLFEAIHAEPYDESAIRSACRTVAGLEEDLAIRRAELAGKLKAELTPEQREKVSQVRETVRVRIAEKAELAFGALDEWVDSHRER
ncbi:MAG: periplasmic heavy metal sensor [Candidatus Aureabacteria bacterium]|nr:periplasmic heavy metal sensor [Candidatus Auribacterota bacterium]